MFLQTLTVLSQHESCSLTSEILSLAHIAEVTPDRCHTIDDKQPGDVEQSESSYLQLCRAGTPEREVSSVQGPGTI